MRKNIQRKGLCVMLGRGFHRKGTGHGVHQHKHATTNSNPKSLKRAMIGEDRTFGGVVELGVCFLKEARRTQTAAQQFCYRKERRKRQQGRGEDR